MIFDEKAKSVGMTLLSNQLHGNKNTTLIFKKYLHLKARQDFPLRRIFATTRITNFDLRSITVEREFELSAYVERKTIIRLIKSIALH